MKEAYASKWNCNCKKILRIQGKNPPGRKERCILKFAGEETLLSSKRASFLAKENLEMREQEGKGEGRMLKESLYQGEKFEG